MVWDCGDATARAAFARNYPAMSKRHVTSVTFVEMISALVSDIVSKFPELSRDGELTVRHLEKALIERGPGVLFVELPQLCKHLDRCLDAGLYSRGDEHAAFHSSHSPSDLLPVIWNGLWAKIFDRETGNLLQGESDLVSSVKLLRQALCLWKKLDFDCPTDARTASILSFVRVDNELPDPPSGWNLGDPVQCSVYANDTTPFWDRVESITALSDRQRARLRAILPAMSAAVCTALGPYNPGDHDFRHGPGAVASASKGCKYTWTNWNDRLDTIYPISEYGYTSHTWWADSLTSGDHLEGDGLIGNEELPSRMVAVPKTFKGPRLIACEPTEMQWCQQNCWSYMRSRVEGSWLSKFIRFSDQTWNQQLCIKGSIDGGLATIDLSDASDRVTPALVDAIFGFNPGFLSALRATRTHSVTLPDGLGVHRLKKFSTMGSACTFPIESITFLVIALSVQLALSDGPWSVRDKMTDWVGKVSVFGDDIIVPKTTFRATCAALEALCFKVNHTKSFAGSYFRESCGVDAFKGEVVTPVYWRKQLVETVEDLTSICETHASLLNAGYHHLANLARTTMLGVLTPRTGSSRSLGIYTPSLTPLQLERPADLPEGMPHDLVSHRYRWNRALQRVEVRVRRVKTTTKRVRVSGHSALLQYFTEKPSPTTNWEAGFTLRSHTRLVWDWEDVYAQFGSEMGRCAEILGILRCR